MNRPDASGGVLGTLFRTEIRMLLRDTRTILITVVAPLVIFPLYILLLNFVEAREQRALEEETYSYAVAGGEEEWVRALVADAIRLEAEDPDTSRAPAVFEESEIPDPEEALREGEIHLLVQGFSASEWDSVQGAEEEGARAAVPAVRLLFRADSDFSREARDRMEERVLQVRALRRDSVFRAAGFPVAMDAVAPLSSESIASAAKEAGAFLGIALTPFLVLLMLSGGSIVAVDAISGEKERGTLETLLTTAAGREEIVRAKLLAVIAVGLSVAVINVANLLLYLVVGLIELPTSLAVELGPLELLLLLCQLVPVAVLVASALLLLSGAARSFKDYQVRFFPVFLAFTIPSFAPVLPGIDLHSVMALVPLAGVAVAVREILVGEVDLPFQLLAFLSTGGLAFWLTVLTERSLSNEKLISGVELDEADLTGGPALFPRHVHRWFLGLWVLFFVVSLWFGEDLGLRGQVLVNLVGIFFGGCLVMIRRYRLNPTRAFALRAPHPAAWLAVLLGAPAALMVGLGLAEVVNTYVFPVPVESMERLAESLVAPELPLWQMVLFVCVMPGVFEELAFRGVLLHGLRPRIRQPWLLALTVGLVFGIFHVSLARIAPTAWLGFVLTWVVLFGGSIYPAMLWHALSNALVLVPAHQGWVGEEFAPSGWWALPAAAILALALWILHRTGPGGRGGGRGDGTAGRGSWSAGAGGGNAQGEGEIRP